MSLRTDRNSGILTCICGVLMSVFAAVALLMVALQRLMLTTMPPIPTSDARGKLFLQTMHRMHDIWLLYMPLMLAGGVVFAIAGFRLLYGSQLARRVAQINASVGYLWLIAYALSCYQFAPTMLDLFASFPGSPPKPALTAFFHFSIVGTTLFQAVLLTGLLYTLSRPRPSS
jgi:hypothetical protein